jgi:uncharacterized protein YbbC (DUF1343 family)
VDSSLIINYLPLVKMRQLFLTVIYIALLLINQNVNSQIYPEKRIIPGAERMTLIIPATKNRVVAIVANHTSMCGNVHLVDTLLSLGVNIQKIFCPEHGFRGTGSAGEHIKNGKDAKTGIPIISLYGKKLKPTAEDLKGIDVVIYDVQDVGVRYYTYISTLTYVMQACAEHFVPLFVLDRPNPNGFYIDGPVLDMKYKSFVGMHPIPLVYGMTTAELATMINDEGWLKTTEKCSIGIIPIANYSHKYLYKLPVNPSPNLQNMPSVYLYPSLGVFEGTVMNVGRGTEFPFQVFGNPKLPDTLFSYTPRSIENISIDPPHAGIVCYGVDLRKLTEEDLVAYKGLNLDYLMFAYAHYPDKLHFFNKYFENLAGNGILRAQITKGLSSEEIKKTWQPDLIKFKALRKKYLIYEDFE